MKFCFSLLIAILFSLFLILWPIFNLFVHHGPQPPSHASLRAFVH
jgi:hypothetical protein